MSDGNLNMSAKGRYSLSVLDENGKIKKEKSINNNTNVVTYAGAYNSLTVNGSDIFDFHYAAIGTGTSEIVRAASSLGSESSGRSDGQGASRQGNETDNGDGTSTVTLSREFTFPIGSKVGTFSEVGVYTANAGGIFVAGQLIKDEFGSPTTVTLVSGEQLLVTYILEWTVPNTSQLIGSGTITDNDSNNYDYEVYAQPYFGYYTVNSSQKSSRYIPSFNLDEFAFRAADGTTSLTGAFDSNCYWTYSHNGTGTVTATMNSNTIAPADYTFTDAVYVGIGASDADTEFADIIDLAKVLAAETSSTLPTVFLKFLNPISKTSSQSFQLGASFTITL